MFTVSATMTVLNRKLGRLSGRLANVASHRRALIS